MAAHLLVMSMIYSQQNKCCTVAKSTIPYITGVDDMGIELCGSCSKLFEVETSIEKPKMRLIPASGVSTKPLVAEVMLVWCCPDCSLDEL